MFPSSPSFRGHHPISYPKNTSSDRCRKPNAQSLTNVPPWVLLRSSLTILTLSWLPRVTSSATFPGPLPTLSLHQLLRAAVLLLRIVPQNVATAPSISLLITAVTSLQNSCECLRWVGGDYSKGRENWKWILHRSAPKFTAMAVHRAHRVSFVSTPPTTSAARWRIVDCFPLMGVQTFC